MDPKDIVDGAAQLATEAQQLAAKAALLAQQATQLAPGAEHGMGFMSLLTVFVLACFVGYYVVWRVTPALHSPLMAVTNAVSSVIIVGALIATSTDVFASKLLGFLAIVLASINIFGGFLVTQRMLSMFKKKQK
jgi:H+-translocating NAD(P) transhydrogenase subunit alpha